MAAGTGVGTPAVNISIFVVFIAATLVIALSVAG